MILSGCGFVKAGLFGESWITADIKNHSLTGPIGFVRMFEKFQDKYLIGGLFSGIDTEARDNIALVDSNYTLSDQLFSGVDLVMLLNSSLQGADESVYISYVNAADLNGGIRILK